MMSFQLCVTPLIQTGFKLVKGGANCLVKGVTLVHLNKYSLPDTPLINET